MIHRYAVKFIHSSGVVTCGYIEGLKKYNPGEYIKVPMGDMTIYIDFEI